jgi:hypothetical protein
MPEFEAEIATERRLTVEGFASRLGAFFLKQWQDMKMPPTPALNDNMFFLVGGYDENKPYGDLYSVQVPSSPKATKLIPDGQFGANWGGQTEMTDRLLRGFDPGLPNIVQEIQGIPANQRDSGLGAKLQGRLGIPVPWQFLPLQDCVDLSIFLVRTTITLQKWVVGVRGVGGAVDVVTITRTGGTKEIQVKQLIGETI